MMNNDQWQITEMGLDLIANSTYLMYLYQSCFSAVLVLVFLKPHISLGLFHRSSTFEFRFVTVEFVVSVITDSQTLGPVPPPLGFRLLIILRQEFALLPRNIPTPVVAKRQI